MFGEQLGIFGRGKYGLLNNKLFVHFKSIPFAWENTCEEAVSN